MGASRKTTEPKNVDSRPKVKRNYSSKTEHDQDCFKLLVAKMIKNKTDYFGDSPKIKRVPSLEHIEHCHFYYTVGKRGDAHELSCATGGHKHKVTYWADENGELKGECGPPIAHGGKVYRYRHPNGKVEEDTHTHEVMYLKSAKVHSKIGQENAKVIAQYLEKNAPKAAIDVPANP